MTIPKLIAAGYTAAEILQTLTKKKPKASSSINKLLAYGYSAGEILKHLTGDKKGKDERYMTSEESVFASHEKERDKFTKLLLSTLGTAAGIGAFAAGNDEQTPVSQGIAEAGNEIPSSEPAKQLPTPEGFPSPRSPEQAELFEKFSRLPESSELIKKSELPSELGLQEEKPNFLRTSEIEKLYPQLPNTAEKMLSAGKTPEEVYSALKSSKFMSPVLRKYEEREGRSYLDALKGFESKSSLPSAEKVVMTPDGRIGEVFHVKDKTAILESNGKKFTAKSDELQPIPKEWETLNVDLSKVPEEDKSAPLSFVAPTEDKKQIVVRFWTKNHKPLVYIYRTKSGEPFDEETLNNIANEVDAPITNGMKFSGAWSQTGKSRGSAFFHRMNKMAQDAEEEDDPNLPYLFVRAPFSFEHGFFKAINKQLSHLEGKFDEFYNPPKRKRPK